MLFNERMFKMVEALSFERLNDKVSEKYDFDEKRIVGIMLARYDLPIAQSIIDNCYLYWHHNTGKIIDIFWAGYGEYLCPDDESGCKIILKFPDNKTRVYYDLTAFISIKNEFNQIFKKPYQDTLQLILVNYYDGKLHFNESIKIDLETNLDSNFANIRQLMEFITNECRETHNVANLVTKLNRERIKGFAKNKLNDITISDVISSIISLVRP